MLNRSRDYYNSLQVPRAFRSMVSKICKEAMVREGSQLKSLVRTRRYPNHIRGVFPESCLKRKYALLIFFAASTDSICQITSLMMTYPGN